MTYPDLPTPSDLRAQDPATSPAAGPRGAACSSGEAAPENSPGVPPLSPSVEEEHAASPPTSLPAGSEHDALRAAPTDLLSAAQVRALLAALPGKVRCEIMLDWPCEGQVTLCSWDLSAEQIMREELHHFDGFDFRVLHDDADTTAPIWQLLAQAIPAMRQLATLQAAALALVEVDDAHRAWLEATPPGLRGEEHEAFLSRFDAAYAVLAQAVRR